MKIPAFVSHFFSTQYMVKKHLRIGEITPSKEAYKSSLRIALPAVAEMVTIALMGMVDTMMVARLGPYAVTAVGLTGQPRMIFLSVFFALNVAVTAIVSRNKGRDDPEAARSCVKQALMAETLLAALMTVLAVVFARGMMDLAGAKTDTIDASSSYFRITGYSIIFQAMSMTICAAQRGVGNTKITMKVNITANVVKVMVNFLLIEGRFGFPRLELEGAAVSTVMATGIGFALALASLLQKDTFLSIRNVKEKTYTAQSVFKNGLIFIKRQLNHWKPDVMMLKSISRVTSGSMLEQLAFRFGFFAYARIVADLGTNSFAAHQIAMQLMNLSFTFADGIGIASTSLVGQNLGKKRPDLSIMYGKIGQRLALGISAVLSAAAFFGRFHFPLLFIADPIADASIVQAAAGIIMILACILPIQTSQLVMAGSLRGAGDTRYVAMTMLITVGFIRPATSFVFIYGFGWGLTGAWLAIIFDQGMRLLLLFTRFSRGKWIQARV